MTTDLYIAAGVFLAGLVSFLSPCVLPLVPPYLAYLGGTTLERMHDDQPIDNAVWRRVVLASLCFVAGLTTVFVALGAGASVVGQTVLGYKDTLASVAGVVIIIFGLHFLGILRIPMLYVEKRYHADMKGVSLAGAYVIGLAFAFGWTPCVGPVLAAVLAVAAQEQSLKTGVWLLLLYSLGLGVPFVLAAIGIKPFLGFMRRFRRHLGRVEKVMGALLVITGVLFLTGGINTFGQWLLENVPVLGAIEDWIAPKGLQGEILKRGQRP
jgi:cytochrome c-type biogenesis protein